VVFELMPAEFTLTELQPYRRGDLRPAAAQAEFPPPGESTALVEPTGEDLDGDGGRPAALFRFRRESCPSAGTGTAARRGLEQSSRPRRPTFAPVNAGAIARVRRLNRNTEYDRGFSWNSCRVIAMLRSFWHPAAQGVTTLEAHVALAERAP